MLNITNCVDEAKKSQFNVNMFIPETFTYVCCLYKLKQRKFHLKIYFLV